MLQPLCAFQQVLSSHDVNPADRRLVEYLPTTFRQSGIELVFSEFNSYHFNADDGRGTITWILYPVWIDAIHHMFKLLLFSFKSSCLLKLHSIDYLVQKNNVSLLVFPTCLIVTSFVIGYHYQRWYTGVYTPATLQLYSNVKGTHESPG